MDARNLEYFVSIDASGITRAAAALHVAQHLTEIFGGVLSEAIKNLRLDIALI